ncbi:MAG: DNA gyrase inhibitor YacG [Gammaproteobacteria bacterium]|nr:DNA gyrase inhibitor YacG [Gammaproteobacteria bacterium]
MSGPKVVSCPTCGKPVVWQVESRWRPFCCERCRLIDLGEWASESRRIPVEDARADFESDQDTPP